MQCCCLAPAICTLPWLHFVQTCCSNPPFLYCTVAPLLRPHPPSPLPTFLPSPTPQLARDEAWQRLQQAAFAHAQGRCEVTSAFLESPAAAVVPRWQCDEQARLLRLVGLRAEAPEVQQVSGLGCVGLHARGGRDGLLLQVSFGCMHLVPHWQCSSHVQAGMLSFYSTSCPVQPVQIPPSCAQVGTLLELRAHNPSAAGHAALLQQLNSWSPADVQLYLSHIDHVAAARSSQQGWGLDLQWLQERGVALPPPLAALSGRR